MYFSFFMFFTLSHHILGTTVCFSHFQGFSVFLPFYRSNSVLLSFSTFFNVSSHISGPIAGVSHVFHFSVFSPHSRSHNVHLTFSTLFSVSLHIQVKQYLFLIFHVFNFLAIIQVKHCLCLIFHVFQFPRHILGQTVFLSHFLPSSIFLAIFQVLLCEFLIVFHFPVFSPYSGSHNVPFSFFTFFSISSHIHILQCVFLIFHLFQFFRHILRQTVFLSHFLPFSMFLALFPVLLCEFPLYFIFQVFGLIPGPQCTLLIFHLFQCFSPYSRSNTVCVSFSKFFSFLAIFQVLECASLTFHVLFVFLAIFQVKQCLCFIFHFFQFSSRNPGPKVCIFHFSCFSLFLAIY